VTSGSNSGQKKKKSPLASLGIAGNVMRKREGLMKDERVNMKMG
jgi:hypothetical protein